MSDKRTVLRLQAEPPLREGQFLQNPVLKRPQALRTLAVFALIGAGISLIGLRPAAAASYHESPAVARIAASEHLSSGNTGAAEARVRLAQIDLTKQRRRATKKKA